MIKTFIVDSFTNKAFNGNPAGVCILKEDLPDNKMLSIAKELGLSETAFVILLTKEEYLIRYFSPKMEIPICGHATLAAAKVLFSIKKDIIKINFRNRDNLLIPVAIVNELIQMQFPSYDTFKIDVNCEVLEALGINEFVESRFNDEMKMILIHIEDCHTLRGLRPDFQSLVSSINGINGILVTSKSNSPEYDFESRYFWPWSGTNEDPVTGATHTFLANFWAQRLNKTSLRSYQCSERTGFMLVEIKKDKILINAEAKLILEGNLTL